MSVHPFVCDKSKPLNSIKSIISPHQHPPNYSHHHSHHHTTSNTHTITCNITQNIPPTSHTHHRSHNHTHHHTCYHIHPELDYKPDIDIIYTSSEASGASWRLSDDQTKCLNSPETDASQPNRHTDRRTDSIDKLTGSS